MSSEANLRVYAVTGVRRPTSEEIHDQGWDAWFSKPLDVANLVARIQEDLQPDAGQYILQSV